MGGTSLYAVQISTEGRPLPYGKPAPYLLNSEFLILNSSFPGIKKGCRAAALTVLFLSFTKQSERKDKPCGDRRAYTERDETGFHSAYDTDRGEYDKACREA